MINKTDIEAVSLSPTAKDFYQIWNELLDTAKNLSLRWDPTTTNESDPGIILLKVLTAIADKINYEQDITALEAFMPSASQLESMQKLCEMMGYNIKYYNSAITDVTIYYNGKEEWKQSLYEIPMFTTFTNSDKSINYFSIESKYLSQNTSGVTIRCMEGQIEQCESDNDNIISIYQLDDQNRYYFKETQIAENGIFVYNVNDGNKSERWTQVSNLNAQKAKSKIYKFGFNSKLAKPYIEFPEDIDLIIEDGLEIYYTRTSGVNGNVTSREISTFMTLPSSLSENLDSSLENYTVVNPSSATNGNNVETIRQAYVNYKKTIGTFDTLVTCRDYMNKIYQLTDENGFNLVSNSVVSDINTDINNSITLCTFNDYGICYKQTTVPNTTMDNFTLTLYPFKHINNLNTKAEYLSSFQLDRSVLSDIQNKIKNIKTLTHKIKLPEVEKTIDQNNDNDIKADIVAIKNYLQLKALITTTSKVNQAEQKVIINNIKVAIYEAFNLHNIDFGEEIPYDTILEVMTSADKRIKNVNLFEPAMITKFLLADNTEYVLGNSFSTTQSISLFDNLSDVEQTARKIYNKLALRNILAGKVPLFNYDTEFKSAFTETRFGTENPVFPSKTSQPQFSLVKLDSETKYKIKTGNKFTPAKLTNGQVIQFRAKNLRTLLTYPAYVNYFIQLKHAGSSTEYAQPAKFISLRQYLYDNYLSLEFDIRFFDKKAISGEQEFFRYLRDNTTVVFIETSNNKFKVVNPETTTYGENSSYFILDVSYETASGRKNFDALKAEILKRKFVDTTVYFSGIYKGLGSNKDNIPGYLIDSTKYKYGLLNFAATNGNFSNYYVQDPAGVGPNNNYNLGKDIVFSGIRKNADYELQTDEFLLINYTKSENSTEASTEEQQESIITQYYGPGTIIKPNFDLYDSQEYADSSNKTFTKTDVDFTSTFEDEGVTLTKKIYSMFTLGTDEKIEIREISNIYLDSSTEYLYWNLNNSSNQLRLVYDNKTDFEGGISLVTYSYSLGENEYIYYTDANKLDMAYYGNGTKVTIYDYIATPIGTDTSYKNDRVYYILDNSVSNDTILSSGLNSVPWVKFNFNSRENTGIKTYMVFTEYQYINLIEGDYISNIDLETPPYVDSEASYIDKQWYKIRNNSITSYYSNGVYKELSKLDFNSASDNFNQWEVSVKYILNCGPDLAQTLSSKGDLITAYAINTSELNTLINKHITDKTDLKDLIDLFIKNNTNDNGESKDTNKLQIKKFKNSKFQDVDTAPSLKSNYDIRNLNGSLYTIIQQTDSDSGEDVYLTDFRIKQTYVEGLQTALNSTISQSLHNVASNLTQFKFSDLFNYKLVTQDLEFDPKNDYVKLNTLIPISNQYGLIMIYYSKTPSDKPNQQNACIRFNNINPKIFNYYSGTATYTPTSMDWWEGKAIKLDGKNYYYELKPGINVIYVGHTEDKNFMQIFPDLYKENASDTSYRLKCTDVITVSDLSIITKATGNDLGINYDLVHYFITSSTDSYIGSDIGKQLLKDISKLDINNEFYYNLTTDNNNVIDINTEVLDSNGQYESLQSANIWFDKNNINNQFVIGEIDIDSIDKGVQVESSSRR